MKQFIVDRHTTPNTPTLEQVPTEKIPIYENRAAVTADLANLTVGQIVATADTGDELAQPVDVVEEDNLHAVTSNAVFENCPRFPDYARGSIYTTQATSFTMPEDGYISYMYVGSANLSLMINNVAVTPIDGIGSPPTYYVAFSGYVKKGDVITRSVGGNISTDTLKVFGLIGA